MKKGLISEFEKAMEMSRKFSSDITVIDYKIYFGGVDHAINSMIECYKDADSHHRRSRDACEYFNMIYFTRYYNYGNEELIAAMHAGLINCIDGKITLNKEKLK
jgi:hypothetical protein